jgi:hypothetical protein
VPSGGDGSESNLIHQRRNAGDQCVCASCGRTDSPEWRKVGATSVLRS